ncbi:hypothetical protein [Escherichia coli]|uniref:hypothetical protein n=1 Tax=Escherichia coli TaxID=562 RepID=UPI0039E1AE28
MHITKSAPLPERPCEQLTCCEKIGSVQGNYINCVKKRHNCRITGKEKATCHGGPSTQISRYPQRMSIADNATFTAGGQGYQPGGRFLVAFNRRGYLSTKSSRANFSGGTKRGAGGGIFVLVSSSSTLAQASDCLCRMISSSCVCVSCIGDSVLLVMILPCKAMRRSSSRHGADSNYSFDSMPRLSNSRRKSLFIHPERLSSPSSFMAMLKRSNKSASRRSCTENLSFLLSLVDIVYLEYNNGLTVTMYTNDTTKAKPAGAMNTNGLLTNNVNEEPLWLP